MFQNYKVAYLRKHVKVHHAERLSFLRQTVAYILSESTRKVPHAAMVIQCDCTNLVEYGRTTQERLAGAALDDETLLRRAIGRNYSAFFLKALAHGLYHVPCMNGFLHYAPFRGGGTFYRAEDINLSFTVHTKHGVIKPIVHNAHQKTLETVAQEMRGLTRRARRTDLEKLYRKVAMTCLRAAIGEFDLTGLPALWILLRCWLTGGFRDDPEYKDVPQDKQLRVTDVLGATCTVANIGMVVAGNQTVTVIIPPEVSMFGIGDIHQAPLVVDGKVVPRWVVGFTAVMDHRAFDAGEAFPFYQCFKRYLDNPALIYEWKPGDPI